VTSARRSFIFRSTAFNQSIAGPNFANPSCFGEDLANWFAQRLIDQGVGVIRSSAPEDFGWFTEFELPDGRFQVIFTLRPLDDTAGDGEWIGRIERATGLLGTIMGRRRKVDKVPIHAVESALQHGSIRDLRWYSDQDFTTEENPSSIAIG